MAKLNDYLGSVQGRKKQKQIKADFEHIMQRLAEIYDLVKDSLPHGAYLTFDDHGKVVTRYCHPGQCPGEDDHGGH